jgi:two-component system, chemotaxis family, chemotaxis protein CheY
MEKTIKATIVVVDDDSMMREMLKLMLRGESYSVVGEASNGQDAIAQCKSLKPDLVLLDINMPKMSGLDALDAILKLDPAPIVLMMSADATMDNVSGAIKKGAAGFVVKPLNAASVLDRIAVTLKSRKK